MDASAVVIMKLVNESRTMDGLEGLGGMRYEPMGRGNRIFVG